jgi:cyclopropane fatty-acyl-phospholipid synthase-like methyltransferase
VRTDTLSAWYADFFTELPNAFWRAAIPPDVTAAEVDLVVDVADLPTGARVLDVPAGSGRHALELARRGYDVVAVDVSAEAVAHLRATAEADGLRVDARQADMRDLRSAYGRTGPADAAICMGNSFGYLDHAGTVAFLADLAALVRPGGTLVIDSGFVAESLLPAVALEEPPMTIGGVEATSVNEYDAAESRWITRFTFRRGAEVHHGTSVQHVYTAAEIGRLVEAAGFTGVRRYGGTDGRPYALRDPRMILVARRS